ncbi:thioredoxin reductase [Babesia caballi]|uniref:Thioredoxin reductase n=1 Tax=Babesia caballi TaxID=5871 RepID=A0AAV4LV80_BABCB|nr:thioredoxin reductase [Babesia caballi]
MPSPLHPPFGVWKAGINAFFHRPKLRVFGSHVRYVFVSRVMMRRPSLLALLTAAAPRVLFSCSYLLTRSGFARCATAPTAGAASHNFISSFSLTGAAGTADMKRPTETMDVETYDFAVIGGGSGGLAAAKEASRLGAKTVLFDYVRPTAHGTKWKLGGTCVNVGCIPKKLFHYAGLLGHSEHDRVALGYTPSDGKHNWHQLVQTVQNYVKQLNFSYTSGLMSAKVKYINAHATLVDRNTIQFTLNNQATQIRAKHVLLAVGKRPSIPKEVKGAYEYAITSDDLMSLKNPPGKTLVVGASYVALECAGFLTGMGFDVTVAVRSILLRGFDRQCVEKVEELMEAVGTKFMRGVLPTSITKLDSGKLEVTFTDGSTSQYDTVMYATGRIPDSTFEDLKALGVELSESGSIVAVDGKTNVENVYAVGDIVEGMPALAPVALKDGEMLARRIFGNSDKKFEREVVPVCVYTPTEYASCGLTEEEAVERYGDVDVYLSEFTSLEHSAVHREKVESVRADEMDVYMPPSCLSKLICKKDGTVIGVHFVGPNAGEVMQGMCLAVRLGAKKQDFDDTIGIHPTDAESFMGLTVTKASGESWVAAGGCGGGRCG